VEPLVLQRKSAWSDLMTAAEVVTVAGSILGVIVAITALVVQTQKLIQIAEQYMVELQKQNYLQAAQSHQIAAAITSSAPASNMGTSTHAQ
jgi:hypothetical protein